MADLVAQPRAGHCLHYLFVVPTIGFDLLYAFVVVRAGRRDLWTNVTANPTAEWVACQITAAFLWDEAPHYLNRDRDRIYGSVVTRRLCAMGIRDKPRMRKTASGAKRTSAKAMLSAVILMAFVELQLSSGTPWP
jgi:hypothetical protein